MFVDARSIMTKKTILITGGAKRIGAALSKHFAQQKHNIVINYFHSEEDANKLSSFINDAGGCAIPYKADVTDSKQVKKLFEHILTNFDNIDVLINNAGVFPPKRTLKELEYIDYLNTLNLNMNAAVITTKEFIKRKNITDGRIINVSSQGGIGIFKQHIDYNVSKSGLIKLTQILAKELAPNISVNCICPGVVKVGNEEIQFPLDKIPMQRFAVIDDIISAADFFVNGSSYITGQVISVSGGMDL